MRAFIRIKDMYFEWSTVVNCISSQPMTREQLVERYAYKHQNFDTILQRLDTAGVSDPDYQSVESYVKGNQMGFDLAELTVEGLYKICCTDEPYSTEWEVK